MGRVLFWEGNFEKKLGGVVGFFREGRFKRFEATPYRPKMMIRTFNKN